MEKIQDYALIGNGRTGALISKKGSIDWLCVPRFDSPSIFGALLDRERGGFWEIRPTSPFKITRNYMEESAVLETRFSTTEGTLCLTDFMTALEEEEKKTSLEPEQELIRELSCEEGEMAIKIHFNPRPGYGKHGIRLQDRGKLGISFAYKSQLLTLKSSCHLSIGKEGATGEILLKKGERALFSLTHAFDAPACIPPIEKTVFLKKERTLKWWKNWSKKCHYQGPYRNEVLRSAITLKLLSFAPSGAFIAALTTSLPERLGGDLNWDYRFCWLRDAAFTVRALFQLGYKEDASAFVSWLLHATRLTLPKLNVLYDVYGRSKAIEKTLSFLKGYFDSKPVRIGNAAQKQFQLDCYGEVMDAVASYVKAGGSLDHETKKMLKKIGRYICKHWKEPDNGMWEERGEPKHYTHSKMMCWVTLDRLIKMNIHERKFSEQRDLIRKEVEEKGWNKKIESYAATFFGKSVDSSLLCFALYGFEKNDSRRMLKTYERIKEKLFTPHGLVYRYEKSLDENEGAFLMCSFWNVEFLALNAKTLDEAKKTFKKLLHFANDVGLYSEEMDPTSQDALGNFPQAFTHIALINAALTIEKRGKDERK